MQKTLVCYSTKTYHGATENTEEFTFVLLCVLRDAVVKS